MSSQPHQMLAMKAVFDGEKVILPEEARGVPPGDVIVIFERANEDQTEWTKAQEATFARTWDNAEDEIYDRL